MQVDCLLFQQSLRAKWIMEHLYNTLYITQLKLFGFFFFPLGGIKALRATKLCVIASGHPNCIRCDYTKPFESQTRHGGQKVRTVF